MNPKRISAREFAANGVLILLPIPTLVLVVLFSYVPAFRAITHSFYRWDGAFVEVFTGLDNYRRMLGNLSLWGPLLLGSALAFVGALAESPRARRIWLASALGAWAICAALLALDARSLPPGTSLRPLLAWVIPAALCVVSLRWTRGKIRAAAVAGFFLCAGATGLAYLIGIRRSGDTLLWSSFELIMIMIAANLLKMWPSILTAVCIHRLRSERMQYLYRVLFVIPMIIPHMVMLLIWKFFYDPNVGPLNKILVSTGMDQVLGWLDRWVFHLGVFTDPFKPAWLGEPSLVIPALLFWGFPWVGVVGVLIYLAGLQNISTSVYEAADLDGISWWGKFTQIELPLIMTQVRLNLIMMIIGTFQAYGFQLVLLGAEGGPGNRGLTPGLYMFFQGFTNQDYGYACAIGLTLFVLILALTIVNNRFVRVRR